MVILLLFSSAFALKLFCVVDPNATCLDRLIHTSSTTYDSNDTDVVDDSDSQSSLSLPRKERLDITTTTEYI